jgi:HlyD family secretion protein
MQIQTKKLTKIITLSLGALIAVGAITAYSFRQEEAQPVEAETTVVEGPRVVSAEAFVVPVQHANLAFETNGRVVTLDVEEGDTVTKGQPVARLDDTTQRIRVAEAEAGLANSEANLAKAGASLAQAQANLADVKAGSTAEKIAQFEADLAKAQAALADVMTGPTPEEIAEAEARIETARANLVNVQAGARPEEIEAAAAKVLQAEAEVRLAQADYDKFVYGEPQVAEPYGVALQQATLNYDSAKADYDRLVNGPTEEEIAVYRAQLYEAEVALDRVQAGATAAQIVQAQADVQRAEAALAELKAGATDEQIAVSEAGVDSAQADVKIAEAGLESAQVTVESALADLAKTVLTSPFDGVIGGMSINEGEYAQTGVGVVTVGDASQWRIETDDLNEMDRVGIDIGSKVTFTVDALPGQAFEGRVTRITPQSEMKAGDVTYTVLIDITEGDVSALGWGMTAFVDIEVGPRV